MRLATVLRRKLNCRLSGTLSAIPHPVFSDRADVNGASIFLCVSAIGLAIYNSPSLKVKCDSLVEVSVGTVSDFSVGGMNEVDLGDGRKVLIMRRGDKWYATGSKCSHYEFDLVKGVSTNMEVVCPLHDASFDIASGRPTRGAGIDGIPTYSVSLKKDQVFVSVPSGKLPVRVTPTMAVRDPANVTTFLVIGGGPAALASVETMRKEGFTGRIVMVSADTLPPYDRIVLSKKFRVPGSDILLRQPEFYATHGIELILSRKVKDLDKLTKQATLDDGTVIKFDKCLIATGTTAHQLPIPGRQLKNVFTLRSAADADALAAAAVSEAKTTVKKAVVIGSGFVGVEAAAMLAGKGLEVTLVGKGSVPFESVLGRRVGAYYAQVLKENKVTFKGNSKAKLLRGRDGTVGAEGADVAAVELDDGDSIAADVVLLATGAVPNTGFLANQFPLAADGSIVVDPLMQVRGATDFYAAGDVATAPQLLTAEDLRVEHWDVALDQGRTAGANMAGKFKPYRQIPFFWTMAFGKSLRYVGSVASPGVAAAWDNVIIEGDVSAGKFVAYYIKGDKIGAVATVGMDPVAVAASECLRRGLMPSPSELLLGTANSQTILTRVEDTTRK